MGDFVSKDEVEKIREHYEEYLRSNESKEDRWARPPNGTYDGSTFRQVSSWYVNRLLRYIEVEDFFAEEPLPKKTVYKTQKIFDCQNMPEDIKIAFFTIYGNRMLPNDTFVHHSVGEIDFFNEEGESSATIDEAAQKVNKYLLDSGASDKEDVLISYWW